MKRALVLVALAAACAKKPPPSDAPVPKSAPPPPSVAVATSLPDASVGWTPCPGPAVSPDEAKKRRATIRARAATPSLHAKTITARRDGSELAIGRARLAIHPWAKIVQTSRGELDVQLAANGEWDDFYGPLVDALLPKEAFVAYVAEGSTLAVRVYLLSDPVAAVSDAIAAAAPALLAEAACAYDEGPTHRDQWRFERVDGPAASRSLLSADLRYGDQGGDAHVDVRIFPKVEGGTLVVACLYAGGDASKSCDTFAASLKLPR